LIFRHKTSGTRQIVGNSSGFVRLLHIGISSNIKAADQFTTF
jgi:hypothetical protein